MTACAGAFAAAQLQNLELIRLAVIAQQ